MVVYLTKKWDFSLDDYHESITDIDNKGLGVGTNGAPLIIDKDLKTINMVLVKNGERSWITMRSCS